MDFGKGIEVNGKKDAKCLRDSFCWTEERIKLLIDVGLEYSRSGYKLNTSFTKEGWTRILTEFNQKCGKQVTMVQLKNKWNVLKAMWVGWLFLKNKTSGWGWNTELGTVDPPSAEHWNAFVKKYPQGKHFKNAPLANEKELHELFHGVLADGEEAICTNDEEVMTSKGLSASNSAVNMEILDSEKSNDDDLPIDVEDMKKKKKHRRRSFSGPCKKSRSNDKSIIEEVLREMVAVEDSKKREIATLVEMKKGNLSETDTFERAYQILESLEGIEFGSKNHVMALEILDDQNKRQAFLSMNATLRTPWFLRAIERKVKDESG